MLTRKEKLLLYCLGRETTPYEAAEKWEKTKGIEMNLGPWYACKAELIEEKRIVRRKGKGREKPIEANITKYLDDILCNNPVQEQLLLLVPEDLVRKYSRRIVDIALLRFPRVFEWGGSLYIPFFVLLFARISSGSHSSSPLQLHKLMASVETLQTLFPLTEILNLLKSFVETLSESEQEDLSLPPITTEKGKQLAMALDPAILLQLLPADLLKDMMISVAKLQKIQQAAS